MTMVTYLSDEWVRSLDEALAGVALAGVAPAGVEPGGPTTVQFDVVDGPGGDRTWHLTLGPTGVRARPGRPAERATVTFTQPWSTALAVARSRRAAPEALLAGDIRVTGDPTGLLPWRAALRAAGASMTELHASTTFPPAEPGA